MGNEKEFIFLEENMKTKMIKTRIYHLKVISIFFFSSSSELVYQMKESFNAWIINPVNKVVFSSLTATDEYRDIYANWRTNRRYY